MEDLLPVVIGGVIGVGGSVVGPAALDLFHAARERRSIARAIAGEVRSILAIVESRQYVEGLRKLIELARKAGDPDGVVSYTFSVHWNPFAVYQANLSKLGLLSRELAFLVPQFYAQANAILDDIRDMRDGTSLAYDLASSLEQLENLLALFESTLALGERILEAANSR